MATGHAIGLLAVVSILCRAMFLALFEGTAEFACCTDGGSQRHPNLTFKYLEPDMWPGWSISMVVLAAQRSTRNWLRKAVVHSDGPAQWGKRTSVRADADIADPTSLGALTLDDSSISPSPAQPNLRT